MTTNYSSTKKPQTTTLTVIDTLLKSSHSQTPLSPNKTHKTSTRLLHQPKLPINFLYTPSEYNKILITNGRNLKNYQPFGNHFQYINQQIIQNLQQYKLSHLTHSQKYPPPSTSRNNIQKITCTCCCCDQYCQQCDLQHNNYQSRHQFTQQQLSNILNKVNSKPLNKKKYFKCYGKQYNITNYKDTLQKQYLSSRKSHRVTTQPTPHNLLLKKYSEQIRQTNKKSFHYPKLPTTNSTQQLPLNKNHIRMQYWKKIKPTIAQSLQKDKHNSPIYQSPNKLNLSSSSYTCNHKTHLSPNQMNYLSRKHQQQAKHKLAQQARLQIANKIYIEQNLKKLQKHRIDHLKKCDKIKFQPSQQMINQAFKNTVQLSSEIC